MNTKPFFAAIVASFVLSGCTASMVSTHGGSKSVYAPVNEIKGGTLKYLNDGYSSAIKARREDAYKKMYQHCGGKYAISSEGPKAEGAVGMPLGGIAVYESSEYWYINFECVANHEQGLPG